MSIRIAVLTDYMKYIRTYYMDNPCYIFAKGTQKG